MKKIAILTSGGDAPGMNTAVAMIAKTARANNLEPYVVIEGYKGLYYNQIEKANLEQLNLSASRGGTLIYSARFPEFKDPQIRQIAIENLKKSNIDSLVVIGGDGSYKGAQLLHEAGVKTIALPGTIDNDIASSDFTIGYDTALNTIVRAIDQIRDTAISHKRIMIVEVMGNLCGDLALYSGLATGAEIIATSEYKMPVEEIVAKAKELTLNRRRRSIIIVVSEKIYDLKQLEKEINQATGWATRSNPLNHIQRGGNPSGQERINASLMAIKAVELLLEQKSGLAIGNIKNDIIAIPILEALNLENKSKTKAVEKAIKFNLINKF
ncbi:6-phosphofructokinase [Mycoplasmopsis cricetuli]|uniref:6-phosphofructokinase n=1 Tax=Mycoplasmopsis cricetuli TaxID=171283 RepID=UPI00046FD8DA|nr:6-phosphofructokinase [Mycoplasmopsis cricetuli]